MHEKAQKGTGMKVQVKSIQGQVVSVELQTTDLVLRMKEHVAKELNKKAIADEVPDYKRIFPGQLKMTYKEQELKESQSVGEIGMADGDTLMVLVGTTENVKLKVKAQLFKGGGVETHPLEVTLSDTGSVIKDKLIAASFGPTDKTYTLFIKGQPFLDNRPLSHYDVDNGTIILVGVIMK